MRIGELAEAVNLPTRTIRYYERRGLLAEPQRASNGYRVYDQQTMDRTRFICRAQAAGFTLAEIRSIIDIWAEGASPCSHVAELLEAKLDDVRQRRRQLAAVERVLKELIERGRSFDPADCRDEEICGMLTHPGGGS
ncbi:MAG: heavy metal-responsive transcriptional regulator [Thermoleophilia bacterium]|nr:heavy metal-responsive transcriptional regulator [Thermoleophilia bacterium]